MRRYRGKDDGKNSFVAGFLAGLTLVINKDQDTRKMFALYLLSRAYDSVHSDLEQKGLFPKLTNSDHVLFIIFVNALFTQLYFFEFQKQKINPSFYAILNNIFSTF